MARDAFGHFEDIHRNSLNGGDGADLGVDDGDGDGEFNEANLEQMIRESTERVYEGSSQNRLQCAIVCFPCARCTQFHTHF